MVKKLDKIYKKKLKKKFRLFNFTKLKHKDRIYVNGVQRTWWILRKENKDNQLTEKTFIKVLKIFMPEYKDSIFAQKKLPGSKFHMISPDYRIELNDATSYNSKTKDVEKIKGIIFEYDGDKHFQSAMQMHADKRKMKEITRLGYRRIRIPFYYQLTEELSKFIFNGLMFHYTGKTFYHPDKWKKAVKEIYIHPVYGTKLTDKDLSEDFPIIGSPGMHKTEYVPSAFNAKGLRAFVKDLYWKSKRSYKNLNQHPDAEFPEASRQQIIKTLELYIKDTNEGKGGKPDELILPSKNHSKYGKNLNNIYHKVKSSFKKRHLTKVFYAREKYDDVFPELYY